MQLIKTSLLSSISVCIRLLTMLGLNKVLAIYVGPAGYAAIGQFQNFMQVMNAVASGAINLGVTKYTAEYYNNLEAQKVLWRTAGTIAIIGSVISSSIIILFHNWMAYYFLNNEDLGSVFIWFSAALIFFVFNALLLAILNGKKEIGRYIIANIAGSIFSLIIVFLMTASHGLYGALIGLALYQSLTFFVTFFLCYKSSWFKLHYFIGKVDPAMAKKLLKYALMSIVSAACIPTTQILIRNYLGSSLGWSSAGYWEAITRLSSAYLMLITTTLSVYYLPKLSELDDPLKIKTEIFNTYKVILPFSICCSIVIYLFRDLIIALIFTPSFIPMKELFAWQLVGDTFKITSWLLGYVYVAKGFTTLYVISEIIFSLLFYLLVVMLVNKFQLKAVVLAYTLNYFFHFIFVLISLKVYRVL